MNIYSFYCVVIAYLYYAYAVYYAKEKAAYLLLSLFNAYIPY
jgi:hypothetical protein